MGIYINKGNEDFQKCLNAEYVDKSGLIAVINKTLDTEMQYSCVTRCRRFGKTMAVKMLRAYYDNSCDSRALFSGLKITSDSSFEKHLNKYPVISLDITDFTTRFKDDPEIVNHIQREIKAEIYETYPDVPRREEDDLMALLFRVYEVTKQRFIMLIDEWDAICREFDANPHVMDDYVNLLRRLFKGSTSMQVFAGVYMTGILPIKKYNTQSALNNFSEYSVIAPGKLDSYFGFTPSEVESLAEGEDVSMDELRKWYDGYSIGREQSIYNPYSVMQALRRGYCENNWAKTGAFDSASDYISKNFEGLKDDIIYMLAGGRCDVVTSTFENDPARVKTKDDVLTLLIHLGYLGYDRDEKQCYIPNKEVAEEMEHAVKACNWEHLNKALNASKRLLSDTLDMDEEAVARGIELAHDDNTSILSYNDENSLACVLSIAYYYARNNYIVHRELASGKGFADIVLIPRRNVNTPALVIELKYGSASSPRASADAAIDQIKRKEYPAKVAEYVGDILLVGINYDKEGPKGKQHTCKIERYKK